MRYTNYTNLDAGFWRPYETGDRLVKGWTGDIDMPPGVAALEVIFALHNRDDRPDGQLCPSMSVGDVVVLAETAWSVDSYGFKPVDLDPADLIVDRTWTEVR
jgi:hypothetical protein